MSTIFWGYYLICRGKIPQATFPHPKVIFQHNDGTYVCYGCNYRSSKGLTDFISLARYLNIIDVKKELKQFHITFGIGKAKHARTEQHFRATRQIWGII